MTTAATNKPTPNRDSNRPKTNVVLSADITVLIYLWMINSKGWCLDFCQSSYG